MKTSHMASVFDDLVSAGRQGCEFGPVEFLFQHVKDIIVDLVGAAHRCQSAAFRDGGVAALLVEPADLPRVFSVSGDFALGGVDVAQDTGGFVLVAGEFGKRRIDQRDAGSGEVAIPNFLENCRKTIATSSSVSMLSKNAIELPNARLRRRLFLPLN